MRVSWPGQAKSWLAQVPLPPGLGKWFQKLHCGDSTALSIWKLEPGPWSIRRSPPKHGQGSTSQLWTSLFDDMPRFPWQLKSTTWIQDLGAHLLHHNKYTNPQNGSTCTLEPGRPSRQTFSSRASFSHDLSYVHPRQRHAMMRKATDCFTATAIARPLQRKAICCNSTACNSTLFQLITRPLIASRCPRKLSVRVP
jgi:hypothetical protein